MKSCPQSQRKIMMGGIDLNIRSMVNFVSGLINDYKQFGRI